MQYMRLTEVQRHELMESLAAMKTFLREAFESLTPQEVQTPGPAGSFSPVEQVWHLADLEREGFGLRIRRLQTEANPRLPDFDGTKVARERNYRSLSLAAGLRTFEAARKANIETLQSLSPQAWVRSGTQDVRFEVRAPAKLRVSECNCSICSKSGYLHLIAPSDRFKLLSGREVLTSYGFNTHTAKHLFCAVCGIKSFYVPRSHPDGFSVNARCLDPGTVESMIVEQFDGKQWEKQYPRGRGEFRPD